MSTIRKLLNDLDWVGVPAGELHMGTPESELVALSQRVSELPVAPEWFRKECPRRMVWVDSFAVARTLLTVAQYVRLASGAGLPAEPTGPPDHPVTVPYTTAHRLVEALARQSGLPVSLPQEAQWERVARGDDTREYPWGDRFSADLANIGEGSRHGTSPVGSYPRGASPFGVLDMCGNLDEWTCSVYAPYPGAPADVPEVETWALDPHVTRGGGWNHQRDAGRCARRHGLYSEGPVGMRLVLTG